jgi:hypothetical protein
MRREEKGKFNCGKGLVLGKGGGDMVKDGKMMIVQE